VKILASKFKSVMELRGVGDAADAAIVKDYGDGWIEVDTLHSSYPRARPGLGDIVKAGLSAIGITEERVTKAIGRECGCSKRAEKLNELGRKIGIG
jgi:hypothetical protein